MTKTRRISQHEIAKELGVSQALVSLALNGQRDRIKLETYQKVWDYAESVGYRPKGIRIETSPDATRSRQIGVILRAGAQIHTQGSYFSHIMHALNTAALDAGFTASVLGSADSLNAEKLSRFFGPSHAIKGVIIIGEVSEEFLGHLQQHTDHIVAVSTRHAGFCHSIIGNEPEALRSIVNHLYELGHRRIGWLGGNVGLARHETRFSGFKASMAQNGLKTDPRYFAFRKEGDRSEGAEAMMGVLKSIKRDDFPTAFVTYNIGMAIGAIRTLQHNGIHVPADISIAAADYSATASNVTPRITAAGCDPLDLGRRAASIIIDSTLDSTDGAYSDLVLPSKLHIGESTAPAIKQS